MDWLEPEEITTDEVDETSAVVDSSSRGRSAVFALLIAALVGVGGLVALSDEPERAEEPAPTTTPAPIATTTTSTTTTTTTIPAPPLRDAFPGESAFEADSPIGLIVFFDQNVSDTDLSAFVATAERTPLVERVALERIDNDFGVRSAASMALRPAATSTDVVDLTIRFEAQTGVDVVWPLVADTPIRVWMDPSASMADVSAVTNLVDAEPAVLSFAVFDQLYTFEEFLGLFTDSDELAREVNLDDLPFAIVIRLDRYNPQADTRAFIETLEELPGVQNVSWRGEDQSR